MSVALPAGILLFQDDDRGFFGWLEGNPGGYFVNSERNPRPAYLVPCARMTGASRCTSFSFRSTQGM